LSNYAIEDRTTLLGIHSTLLQLDMLEGREDEARREISVMRQLQEKPAAKLINGLWNEAWVDGRHDAHGEPTAFLQSFLQHYSEALQKLPWAVVRDTATEMKVGMETCR
jgi:hypothetical protein